MPTSYTHNNITANVPLLGDSANVVYAFRDYHETISGDIDSKANKANPTFTGTATFPTIESGNVTVTTLATLPTNTSIGSVSSTEISYLDGLTSNVQAQLNTTNQFISPTGSVIMWTTSAAPTNWLLCDGAAVSRTTYAALFSVIGTTYGAGDGSTTFNVPNMVGKMPIGVDSNQAEFNVLGETGGAKTVTLATTNLPAHTHSVTHDHGAVTTSSDSHSHSGTTGSAGSHTHTVTDGGSGAVTVGTSGSTTGAADNISTTRTTSSSGSHTHTFSTSSDTHSHSVDIPSITVTSGSTGSGTAFSILPPYLALNFIIKT